MHKTRLLDEGNLGAVQAHAGGSDLGELGHVGAVAQAPTTLKIRPVSRVPTGNAVSGQPDREFESRPLRQLTGWHAITNPCREMGARLASMRGLTSGAQDDPLLSVLPIREPGNKRIEDGKRHEPD